MFNEIKIETRTKPEIKEDEYGNYIIIVKNVDDVKMGLEFQKKHIMSSIDDDVLSETILYNADESDIVRYIDNCGLSEAIDIIDELDMKDEILDHFTI